MILEKIGRPLINEILGKGLNISIPASLGVDFSETLLNHSTGYLYLQTSPKWNNATAFVDFLWAQISNLMGDLDIASAVLLGEDFWQLTEEEKTKLIGHRLIRPYAT